MTDTVRVTFLFSIGQRVRYADAPAVYTIANRTYMERQVMGPVVTYRLERKGLLLDTVYEPDIVPVEDDAHG